MKIKYRNSLFKIKRTSYHWIYTIEHSVLFYSIIESSSGKWSFFPDGNSNNITTDGNIMNDKLIYKHL